MSSFVMTERERANVIALVESENFPGPMPCGYEVPRAVRVRPGPMGVWVEDGGGFVPPEEAFAVAVAWMRAAVRAMRISQGGAL